jgi:hypothetical protein
MLRDPQGLKRFLMRGRLKIKGAFQNPESLNWVAGEWIQVLLLEMGCA